MSDTELIFYHAPKTRSSCVLALLEELDAPYALRDLNFRLGAQRQPDYLAINPMGKVPAILHKGALVTELPAIFIYLADAFPQKKLAPSIDDPLRGPYLRWLVFYSAAFEPAVLDRLTKREPPPRGMNPYGDFDTTLATLESQLAQGRYLLGERFTAADLLWGAYARRKGAGIDRKKHLVLECAHPSPLSAHNGFFGCRHFSQANAWLVTHGETPIDW